SFISRLARAYGPRVEETTLNLAVLGFSRPFRCFAASGMRLKAGHQRLLEPVSFGWGVLMTG
ncbi:hypothetical protein CKO51_00005, partial [Rhodopirellula sp. SM50]